jgi:hypothetical protein
VKGIMENLVENEDISIKGIFRIIRNSKERTATKIC